MFVAHVCGSTRPGTHAQTQLAMTVWLGSASYPLEKIGHATRSGWIRCAPFLLKIVIRRPRSVFAHTKNISQSLARSSTLAPTASSVHTTTARQVRRSSAGFVTKRQTCLLGAMGSISTSDVCHAPTHVHHRHRRQPSARAKPCQLVGLSSSQYLVGSAR